MAQYSTKEQLYAVLDKTVATLQASERFTKRIANAQSSLGIVVPELEAQYTLSFKQGQLLGAVGGADAATIAITLSSVTLDKLFSGKLDGESAYMYGHLKLRGDEWAAESMVGYLYELGPAYVEASAAVA